MKEIFRKRSEYLKKSISLRNVDNKNLTYENRSKLFNEQQNYYDKWLFFKNLDESMRRIENAKS